MTDAERQRLAAAATTDAYQRTMAATPGTWFKLAVILVVVMALSVTATLVWYPWEVPRQLPVWYRPILLVSFVPTIGAVIAVSWLFVQSLGLHLQPTVRHLALIAGAERTPDGSWLELAHADGRVTRHRCRRTAASMVKVGTIVPGEVGVALCKGDTVLEWHPIAG